MVRVKEVPFVKIWSCYTVSADMKDDLDIMRQCRQLYAQGNALARRLYVLGQCESNYFSLLLFFILATVVEVQG